LARRFGDGRSGTRRIGVWPGWRAFGLTLLVAAIVVVSAFGLVFLADYFFHTDFRIWVLAIKAFGPDKISIALMYLPLFAVYFVANAFAVNVFNRFQVFGKEWLNTALVSLFAALGPIVLVVIQYSTFFVTGLPTEAISPITGI